MCSVKVIVAKRKSPSSKRVLCVLSAIVDLLILPKTRALVVERAAPLLGVLLGGGDDIRTRVAAGSRSSNRSSSRNVRVADTDTGADANARSKEVGIKGNRGWGLV